ncbi:MAG: M56 family metallopeptidase [Lachnospiraceae bacterium]|nr:M56 family metallopeptidase [Lachnospiraceae bacterium]
MNIEICMTLTGSIIILFYLMLKPWKGKYINAVHYQWVLRIALMFYILPFQMVKYPVRNVLKFLNLGKSDAGVYHYSNLEYKYINKAFYYSETFQREAKLFIWVIAVGIMFLVVIYQYIQFRKAANLMEPVRDQKILQTVSSVKGQINLHRKVKVFYSDRIKATFTIGTFEPVVVLWGNDMRSDNLEVILKHELMHVKNLDNMFQYLSLLAVAINWYNPLCYYLFYEMRRLDEETCDCRVVVQMDKNERRAYRDLILERAVYEGRRLGKMFIGLRSSSKVLCERTRMIMNYKRYDKKSKMRTIIFMMSAAICVFSAASFSVLAYEEPSEIAVSYTESFDVADAAFSVEGTENAYFNINVNAFESSDRIFIDENGKIYPIYDEVTPKRGCSHSWQNGTFSEHIKSGGGCMVRVYDAQRCSKCGDVIVGELTNTVTFTTCPH